METEFDRIKKVYDYIEANPSKINMFINIIYSVNDVSNDFRFNTADFECDVFRDYALRLKINHIFYNIKYGGKNNTVNEKLLQIFEAIIAG